MKKTALTALLVTIAAVTVYVISRHSPFSTDRQRSLDTPAPAEPVNAIVCGSETDTGSPVSDVERTEPPVSSLPADPSRTVSEWSVPCAEDLSAEMKTIYGMRGTTCGERLRAIHDLPDELSEHQQSNLLHFLRKPVTGDELDITSFNALKNDIVNALHDQKSSDLADQLIDMYNNTSNDIVWRTYCLQHLAFCYEYSPEDRSLITNTLWEAGRQLQDTRGGTALLILTHLSSTDQSIDTAELMQRSQQAALDPSAAIPNRMSALSLCGRAGNSNILEQVRQMAETEPDTNLRMVAIATLGYLGNAVDLDQLEKYTNARDDRISRSAVGAIRRLKNQYSLEQTKEDPDND